MNSLQIKVDELWRGVITHDMKAKFNFVLLTSMSLITEKYVISVKKVITLIVQKQNYDLVKSSMAIYTYLDIN